jgi:hypothetical protein
VRDRSKNEIPNAATAQLRIESIGAKSIATIVANTDGDDDALNSGARISSSGAGRISVSIVKSAEEILSPTMRHMMADMGMPVKTAVQAEVAIRYCLQSLALPLASPSGAGEAKGHIHDMHHRLMSLSRSIVTPMTDEKLGPVMRGVLSKLGMPANTVLEVEVLLRLHCQRL